ncbi:YceI family protein [Nitrospinae bacterium AH_259_B05_G02_I21]|nr:YceI family protein [Nitrospinae bacterium AH_259_B05_G02_I21]
MRRTVVTALAALVVVAAAAPEAWSADRYKIDPVHTFVGFAVRHLVISKVRGQFNEFSGTILYDEDDITKSSVAITIKAASIDTRHAKRDSDLRSPDFLDVKRFPTITFRSSRVEKRGEGYVAVGTLTIHGVPREVELPFTLLGTVRDPWGNTRIGVEAALTINRKDFGIVWDGRMDNGGLVVGNKVEITIAAEAIKS